MDMEAAMKRIPPHSAEAEQAVARCDADEQGGHYGGLRDIIRG